MPGEARPLKILYVIDEMQALTAGGTERQLLQMITLMKAAGHTVHLALFRGTEWLTEAEAGCPIRRCAIGRVFSPDGWRRLRALEAWMQAERFDVVQSFFVEANIFIPPRARRAGVPVVLGSRRNLNYWMGAFQRWLQRRSNRHVTRLVANCEAVKQAVAKFEGIAAERVDVIYNGLDVQRFRPDPARRTAQRRALGHGESEVVVGTVSVLRPVKGCETFVRAAAMVADHSPQARFLLVGDGSLRGELEQLGRELGISERLRFAGSQEDVRPFLQAMDIAVLASESEGFSNSILEYAASGKPIVASDVGGNREAAGEGGVMVPPADPGRLAEALIRLIDDPAGRARMASEALIHAQSFSLERAQATLSSYYQGLAGAGAK